MCVCVCGWGGGGGGGVPAVRPGSVSKRRIIIYQRSSVVSRAC